MTKEDFKQLTQQTTFLDGSTGSVLMGRGMPRGICTEHWIMQHEELIIELQQEYMEAGSQIIYAPTFGANPVNLAKFSLEEQISEINHTLVSFSKTAAAGKAYVAGDITTTGEMMEPLGEMTYERALEAYKIQIQHLADAGVDLLVAETLFDVQEACAILDAASSVCDLPVMCTMTSEADGSFFTGGNIIEAAQMLEGAGAAAVGLNCSVGPDQLVSVIRSISEAVSVPVIAKPNAGMPHITDTGAAVYDMSAKDFAKHMAALKENGARILGGCCGTTPEYIREMVTLLAQ